MPGLPFCPSLHDVLDLRGGLASFTFPLISGVQVFATLDRYTLGTVAGSTNVSRSDGILLI